MPRVFNFLFAVEDQRDWQRLPNCFRNPFSCFICHLFNVFEIREILDLNYGVGGFYEKCPNAARVTGVDVKKWPWLVKPDTFILSDMNTVLKAIKHEYDAVVLDPPFNTKPSSALGNRKAYLYYGNVKFTEILHVINTVKQRNMAKYIILKYMPKDTTEEIKLIQLSKYRIMWRFIRYTIPAHSGNKVIRNYTQIFII
jgi:hypothetical protein